MISNNQVICTYLLSTLPVASPAPGMGGLTAGVGWGGKALAMKGHGISLSGGQKHTRWAVGTPAAMCQLGEGLAEGLDFSCAPVHPSPPAATTDPAPPFMTHRQALPLPWLRFPTCKLCIKGNGMTTVRAFLPPPKCCLSPSSGQMCQNMPNTPSTACPVGRIREKPRLPLFTP